MPVCVVTRNEHQSDLSNVLASIVLDAYALYRDSLDRVDPSEATMERIIENTTQIQICQTAIHLEKGTGWT